MTQTLTKKNISVTLENPVAVGRGPDNNLIVQCDPVQGCKILSYTPAFDGENGAMKNNRGYNGINIHTNNPNLPVICFPGDTFIITRKAAVKGVSDRTSYWNVPGRSDVDEMMAITFVDWNPNIQTFRPSAMGDGPIPRFLRSTPVTINRVNMSRLPSVIPFSALQSSYSPQQAATYFSDLFSDFSGDLYNGWSTDTRTPDYQHPGYGSYMGGVVSQALTFLCTDVSVSLKYGLAINLVQWGLDLAGAWADGRQGDANGGHCQGRKALIVLAGHLLDVEPIANPSAFVGPAFQEDKAYYKGAPAWWFGWNYGWRYNDSQNKYTQKPPSQWTNGGVGSEVWQMGGYMEHGCGCQAGSVLAMKLMNREKEFGENICGMVTQWMVGPSGADKAALQAVGLNLPWGKSYAVGFDDQFCARAWKAVIS